MMTRHFWVLIHRFAGLALALNLIIVSLTGSVLVFRDELDAWLFNQPSTRSEKQSPHVDIQTAPLLDPFKLHEQAKRQAPEASFNSINLQPKHGEAFRIEGGIAPRIDLATGKNYELDFDAVFLNPYTGVLIGKRPIDSEENFFPLNRKNLFEFIYRLHCYLAMPDIGGFGGWWIVGIAAFVWTLDCFVGFYLTLPPRRKQSPHGVGWVRRVSLWTLRLYSVCARRLSLCGYNPPNIIQFPMVYVSRKNILKSKHISLAHLTLPTKLPKPYFSNANISARHSDNPCRNDDFLIEWTFKQNSFWQRWKPAWQIKWRASAFRLNFDLHRAFGLWTWVILLMFAWSGVRFDLPEVYYPVIDLLFERHPEDQIFNSFVSSTDDEIEEKVLAQTPKPPGVSEQPIDFRSAHTIAKQLMAEQARLHGFKVNQEGVLEYYSEGNGKSRFRYGVETDKVIGTTFIPLTYINFDADSGQFLNLEPRPVGEYAGSTVGYWLAALHQGEIWGLPYRIFVCFMALVITILSVTGIYIWYKKHRAARLKRKMSKYKGIVT